MKKFSWKRVVCFLLSLLIVCSSVMLYPTDVKAADGYVNIMHKISTARPNFPIRYNFSLAKEADIYFDLRINERTTVGLTILTQKDEIPVKSDTLPSTDPKWQYNASNGIYQNTHTMHLPAGEYILEMNFEAEVNYDLSVSLISEVAKLNYSKVTITKGFTKQLKVNGGTIKSCSSSNKKVAIVTKSGKVTGKQTGTAKIKVKLTNGKTLTCNATVKANKYSAKKLTISDTTYNTYEMKTYSAAFDSKGNLVVKFVVANNSYGKLTKIPDFKITVKDSKKTVVASYKKSSYPISVNSYSEKSYTVVIPKSKLKTKASKIDLRNCSYSISGDSASSTL